jgi:hypothetical protein
VVVTGASVVVVVVVTGASVVVVVVVVVISHSPRGVTTTSPVDVISPATVHITRDNGPSIGTGPKGSVSPQGV